ncbi:MAG TPA: OsmC family protein [Albitalea sp.]
MDDNFTLELVRQADFRFETRFDNPALPVLVTDEPPPLGGDAGPNPARLLTVAVANCLSASLLFALRKFKNDPGAMRAVATTRLARNDQNRMRIAGIDVVLHLGVPGAEMKSLDRALDQFEEFCIVTQSVRAAFPVGVTVHDSHGSVLKP